MGASRYADEAAVAFCDRPWRFDCGYSGSPYRCATETLEAIAPRCKAASLAKLEGVVLAYVDPYEKRKEGVRQRGWAAFNLLSAIPAGLRSDQANRRFQEWQCKFGEPAVVPRGAVADVIGSPVAGEDANKIGDDDWLGVIAADKDGRSRFENGELRWEAFGKAVQKEPLRFARLGIRLPPEANSVYFSALLRGLAGKTIDQNAKVAVCQRVFEHAGAECGDDIANLLARATAPLPDHALHMLVRLAIESDDLEHDERWTQDSGDAQFYSDGDINLNYISTSRRTSCWAAQAIGDLIHMDSRYVSRLEPDLDELVRVRSAVVGYVAYVLREVAYHDVALGNDLFLRMHFSEERLLGTRHVREFMRENLRHGFGKLRGIVVRMLRSPHPNVSRAGARLACMAAFFDDDARELAEESQQGHIHQRRGCVDPIVAG